MELRLRLVKHLLEVATPIVTSSIFAASPSLATTLAFSGGELNFYNINQVSQDIATSTNTDTFTTALSGSTLALADAESIFGDHASGDTSSLTFSNAQESQALADSVSQYISNFSLEGNELFSLDFAAYLGLEVLADNPEFEPASAMGNLSFFLIDSNNQTIYDSFNLIGNLSNQTDDDYLGYLASENIVLTNSSTEISSGRTQEFVNLFVQGSLQHHFASPTNLTLVAVTTNHARVKTPEPSNVLALLGFFSSIGVWLKVSQTLRVRPKSTQRLPLGSTKIGSTSRL